MRTAAAMVLGAWTALCAGAPVLGQDEVDRALASAITRAAKARGEGRLDDMKREVVGAAALAGKATPRVRVLAAELLDQGFPELAAQAATQGLAGAPGDVVLTGILGIAQLRGKKYVEAIASLRTATEKDPGRFQWWLELGRAHLHANQEAAALAAIERAAALAPDDLGGLELRAECEYRNMRLPQCEATSKALLARSPANAMAWQLLIRVRRTQGRLEEALASADDAIKAVGRHPDLVLERGLVLLAAGRNEDAAKDLREAADRLPNDARPWLHLCKAYTRLGLAAEAAAAKARYLVLSPDLPKTDSRKSAR
jgi:predicted Zn-dependent protease